MLRLTEITYAVEGRPLFEAASATIPTGHKVGLVGANGAGKTTLFRLIRGELALESGEITLPRNARIGGVAQEAPASSVSLIDTVLAADEERAALLAEAVHATDPLRIAEIQHRLTDIDAWSAEARAAAILSGLGFDAEAQARPCSDFSGGWRMRVALAGVLFAQPDLLLLDEPTNYLDLEGALWLESYLARYPHTVIVISHDRGLLNRAVGAILHLENRKLTLWSGGYDAFARARAERAAVQAAEARKQAARRAHLQSFVDRFRYKASKAVQAQSRLKMLEKMTPILAPDAARRVAFAFPAPEQLSPPIITMEGAAVGYGGDPVLRRLTLRIDQDDRIALLGRNGEGKSTLSKLLAGKLQPDTGRITRSSKLRIGYFAQHQVDELVIGETPLQHLQRMRRDEAPAKLRARLAGFGLGADQAETEVGRLSGGQKARLSLLLATLDAPHLLILDEPTNHLDIESREALVEALTEYAGAVVLVSHDMHLLGLVADRLWLVKDAGVSAYAGDLDQYRQELLSGEERAPAQTRAPTGDQTGAAGKPRAERPSREAVLALRAEVRRCEERIEKLARMREKLSARLADPMLYDEARVAELEGWNRKFVELEEAEVKAEALWLGAQERLEAAERG
ncbi:MAG: ABC-F family ATP-binding cassette domain-containing protein [Defluviimonas sp.]|uniref:ABC-F family ATP-binding cassette domain-containing protein n=1 Tax=Albidovulum sp. TaxID=1872424 RepID=UPI001D7B1210|nr:ABC-F family ATP-binding cassette domain-containing protein [Paracoccaceae bacterium]MCC0063870.1 ABC-F family ATP-binding cassette domain-containing protein [Defluviimonas sp.]